MTQFICHLVIVTYDRERFHECKLRLIRWSSLKEFTLSEMQVVCKVRRLEFLKIIENRQTTTIRHFMQHLCVRPVSFTAIFGRMEQGISVLLSSVVNVFQERLFQLFL